MKLAILIGASGATKESPRVPLAEGNHKLIATGLHDTQYLVQLDDGNFCQLHETIPGGQSIKLIQDRAGTEDSSICIYAERIEADGNEHQ